MSVYNDSFLVDNDSVDNDDDFILQTVIFINKVSIMFNHWGVEIIINFFLFVACPTKLIIIKSLESIRLYIRKQNYWSFSVSIARI